MSQRVLVLDLTHGGEVLAREYAGRGDSVTAVDIYHTVSATTVAALTAAGVRVAEVPPPETFDLGVVPIHCPDRYIGEARLDRRVTAHQAVGELAHFDIPVVEFTGVRGKTSACHVLGHILADRGLEVLLLTSRGLCTMNAEGRTVLKDRISIAPPSVLALSKSPPMTDIGVFEVSLGGTGLADVAVITSLDDDYPIAAETRKAFDGKVQMMRSAHKVAVFPFKERDRWSPHVPAGVESITFGPGGDLAIELPERLILGRSCPLTVHWRGETFTANLPGSYLAPSYATAFASALAAAAGLGANMKAAVSSLETFKGVPGRGEVTRERGAFVIRERNPGVSAASIGWNVDVLERYYGQNDIGVALDPVNIKVCEKLDLRDVRNVLDHHPAVKGRYIINMPGLDRSSTGFLRLGGFMDVRGKHQVLMCCIKEGYL
jgi:coenzyme F430 synthetase